MTNISGDTLLVMMNQSVTITSDVTMRNGDLANGNVSCHLPNGNHVLGYLQSGVASCSVDGSMLSPGPAMIELRIEDYSFSDWLEFSVTRLGMPLEITSPIPTISLNQHSSVTVTPDIFAYDPDGEDVVFLSAVMIDDNESILQVNNSLTSLSISHVNLPEWDGTMEMALVLAAGDDVANITVNVTVLPVNDMVVQIDVIPQQQSVEDGQSIIVDISNYVSDPEGEPLVVTPSRDYPGLRINTSLSTILIDPQTHWNGAELVELYVSDGETEALSIFVPINIEPVNDIVEFSDSTLELEMEEDGVLIINLENYTIDVDGDDLVYEVTGISEIVGFSLSGSDLVFAGNPDLFGISQFEVNVTDGSNYSTMSLVLNTKSVPDLPVVGVSSIDLDGNTISILWTIADNDGDAGLIYSVTFAGESIEQGTECAGNKLLTCVTYTGLGEDGIYTVEIKVWDSHAQEWSNNVTQEVEVKALVITQDDAESETAIGDWVLPIGLGLLVILLLGYMIQSKKD